MFSLYHFQRGLQTHCYDLQKVNEVTVLECLGTVSYKTDYFNAREIVRTLLLHFLCHVYIHSVFVLFNAMVYIIMSVWQQEARLYTLLANKN